MRRSELGGGALDFPERRSRLPSQDSRAYRADPFAEGVKLRFDFGEVIDPGL
jgi:hypothetical protein